MRIPRGWAPETEWERQLLLALRNKGGRLQLFSEAELSEEVVDATPDEARYELQILRRQTEVRAIARALDLDVAKEDWRFVHFMDSTYPDVEYSTGGNSPKYWADPLYRLGFLYWLRGEPIMRSIRQREGLPCEEIEEVIAAKAAKKSCGSLMSPKMFASRVADL